eukprot:CAMPEP_0172655752 /NCGR_PEP_ID=MMETSP1074-20121228/899_1 /TAXON_ID=2916 /ORGANISM="Ceratium fusus, Strain PA161109" /LENGTH=123 /DNA_ID=CAMNT_0013470471 /DNA_START=113 /DNA_END=484 /DNA_ORIENTATION=-
MARAKKAAVAAPKPVAPKPVAPKPIDKFYEVMAGGWTVGGILHATGVHKGAVQYRYKAPKSDDWLPGGTALPAKLESEIVAAKLKVKQTLRTRLEKADGKAAKKPTKAAPKGNGLVKKTKGKK